MENNYDVLICYDIDAKHDHAIYGDVKKAMIDNGYADRLIDLADSQRRTMYLPNTTLWKKNTPVVAAREDLQACINDYNKRNSTSHVLERCISLEFTSIWTGVYGKAHVSTSTSPEKNRN